MLYRGCGLYRLDRGMEPTMPAVFDNPRLRAAAAVNRRRSLGLRTRYSLAATAVVVMVMVVMVPFNEEGPRRIRRYVHATKMNLCLQ